MTDLNDFIVQSMARPVPSEVHDIGQQILARHPGALSIINYGSTLRAAPTQDTLIDYYVVVADQRDLAASAILQMVGALIPPNVYFMETQFGGNLYRSKYAVVTLDTLRRQVSSGTGNPYFWARFAQPSVMVYARDDNIRQQVFGIVAQAMTTAYGYAMSLSPTGDAIMQWQALFSETYKTELRPEGPGRASAIVESDTRYYKHVSELLKDVPRLTQSWPLARLWGKVLTVCRLSKAAFTFAGGVDYVVWKIQRHSGERIELTPRQRRHPLLTGICLLPRLLFRGTVR